MYTGGVNLVTWRCRFCEKNYQPVFRLIPDTRCHREVRKSSKISRINALNFVKIRAKLSKFWGITDKLIILITSKLAPFPPNCAFQAVYLNFIVSVAIFWVLTIFRPARSFGSASFRVDLKSMVSVRLHYCACAELVLAILLEFFFRNFETDEI